MLNFKVDIDKSIQATLFVLNQVGGTCDFHKIFKVLYFADQKHLARFGRPITGDNYVAMKNGPVPSNIYDILKSIRTETVFSDYAKQYMPLFDVRMNHFAVAKQEADLEYLSETDVECLNEALQENKDLNFKQLTDKSHDPAYNQALKDDYIPLLEIAKVGGANEAMLNYIQLNVQNQRALQ